VILVIGGHSKIGSALIGELRQRNQAVRVLVRAGAGGVIGDLADRASLKTAMSGVDRVFLLCGPTEQEVQLNMNAIDTAKAAGVRLLVRSSILGSDPASRATFVSHHGASDAYLRQSGVPYVIVRPNLFMQNVPESTIPSIDPTGTFYFNAADARISMVDTRDVAAVAAVALTAAGHEGRTYDVTGPEALSYADVAQRVAQKLGRDVRYVDAPDDAVKQALLGFGLSEWMAGALVDLYQDYKRSGTNGYAAAVTDTVRTLTGKPARSLDQLLS
jgi:uncharacterized protein YbjT (DUF2867 family)